MPEELRAYCKACETELGDPNNEVNFSEIEEFDNPDGHIRLEIGSKGPRFYCSDLGHLTTIIDQNGERLTTAKEFLPDDYSSPSEGNGEDKEQDIGNAQAQTQQETTQPQQESTQRERGLDFPQEKEPIDLLKEVVENPLYELSDPQIREVISWAEEFEDSQIPPDSLQQILGLLEGVSQQKAQLMRQKYELKLNRWIRSRSGNDSGPPIGAITSGYGTSPTTPSLTQSRSRQSSRSRNQQTESSETSQTDSDDTEHEINTEGLSRRERRINRRQDALDIAVQEAAEDVADAMAEEFANQFGFTIRLARRILMRKAEKDPDWFIEKAEQWDIDIIDEFLTPSEQRAEELAEERNSATMSVDQEIDDVADIIEEQPEPEQDMESEILEEEQIDEESEIETEESEEDEMFKKTLGQIEGE